MYYNNLYGTHISGVFKNFQFLGGAYFLNTVIYCTVERDTPSTPLNNTL